jgi:hypothetical protein
LSYKLELKAKSAQTFFYQKERKKIPISKCHKLYGALFGGFGVIGEPKRTHNPLKNHDIVRSYFSKCQSRYRLFNADKLKVLGARKKHKTNPLFQVDGLTGAYMFAYKALSASK